MATFADLAHAADTANKAIVTALSENGPQWMTGDGGIVWVYCLDGSEVGYRILRATAASTTAAKFPNPAAPVMTSPAPPVPNG